MTYGINISSILLTTEMNLLTLSARLSRFKKEDYERSSFRLCEVNKISCDGHNQQLEDYRLKNKAPGIGRRSRPRHTLIPEIN